MPVNVVDGDKFKNKKTKNRNEEKRMRILYLSLQMLILTILLQFVRYVCITAILINVKLSETNQLNMAETLCSAEKYLYTNVVTFDIETILRTYLVSAPSTLSLYSWFIYTKNTLMSRGVKQKQTQSFRPKSCRGFGGECIMRGYCHHQTLTDDGKLDERIHYA